MREHGATAVFLAPMTVNELVSRRRAFPVNADPAHEALDVSTLKFVDGNEGHLAYQGLKQKGVADLALSPDGLVLSRDHHSFLPLRDVETDVDPRVLQAALVIGLRPIYRLNRDPWTSWWDIRKNLNPDPAPQAGFLFNTDLPPGGSEALPYWKSWVDHHQQILPFFEFRPSKASAQMAFLDPADAYRAHTIPSLELKDMTRDQERSRWRRAVDERSCRILLVHASPNDSSTDYFDRLEILRQDLATHRWRLGFPTWRPTWRVHPGWMLSLRTVMAFGMATVFPWWGLWLALRRREPTRAFLLLSLITILGGSLASTLALSPYTQLELTPFRGIKLAFLAGWLGSVFILYRPNELAEILRQFVKRSDVVIGAILVAVVAYAMIRSGNASAAWKHPLEQGLRDRLEEFLWVRPRFKEFAFGHPLLLLGFALGVPRWKSPSEHSGPKRGPDGRMVILLGMSGQASMMNTFCHLHSPIATAYARAIIGIVFGLILGGILIRFTRAPIVQSLKESRT